MRILYIGHARSWHVSKWLEYFVDVGHEVFLFSPDPSNIPHNVLMPFGVKKFYFYKSKFGRLINLLLACRKLRCLINEIQPDVLHAHELIPYGIWAAMSGFNPFVFTPMGSDILIQAQKCFALGMIARYVFLKADVVTGDSLVLQEAGYRLGARPMNNYVIQNGVDTTQFKADIDKKYLRRKYGLDDNAPVILSPRALTLLYNIDTILQSIPIVLKNYPQAKFIFLYAFGEERENELQTLANNLGVGHAIIWVGYIPYEEVPLFYAGADLIVSVPSSDSSPRSVYEAMACGTTVILSNLPWTKDLIKDEGNALLVPPGDPDLLGKAVIRCLNDQALRVKLQDNALKLVRQRLDYHFNMKLMESIYKDLIQSTSRK